MANVATSMRGQSPTCGWTISGSAPRSRTVRSRAAAIEVLQQAVGAWDKFELSADEFVEQDDTVIVLGHTDLAKGERSARLPVVHTSWRYRGDDEICRLQDLTDTLESARMLGIA